VSLTYSKCNYLKMLTGLGVRMGHWTLAQYAALPGIALNTKYNPVVTPSLDITYRDSITPYGFMCRRFALTRGSIKVMLQFFCSAFVSARFAVYVIPPDDVSENFDDYVVRIIDVKGDTTNAFTIPFLCPTTWSESPNPPFRIRLKVLSPIIGFDAAADTSIGLVAWISGGPDTQFANPTFQDFDYVPISPLPAPPPEPKALTRALTRTDPILSSSKLPPGVEKQSAIAQDFEKGFDPIINGCNFVVCNGYSVSDAPVSFNDLWKRYQPMHGTPPLLGDLIPLSIYIDNLSYHGLTLGCFAARRGGYRLKTQIPNPAPDPLGLPGDFVPFLDFYNSTAPAGSGIEMFGLSLATTDGYHHFSVPWNSKVPWANYKFPGTAYQIILPDSPGIGLGFAQIAVRDDFETGLPILPGSDIGSDLRISAFKRALPSTKILPPR